MARVITDGVPVENAYEPPERPQTKQSPVIGEAFVQALSNAIIAGFRNMPPPVVHVEPSIVRPEVKINSPVYVTAPEVKVPPMTVNVPEGKVPVVNIEPATVTLQTNRPSKWHFTFHRDEFGRMTSADVEAK